jgi:hypothetical protein
MTAATDTNATTEKLLELVSSIGSVPRLHEEGLQGTESKLIKSPVRLETKIDVAATTQQQL